MPASRPSIPAATQRAVRVEAGHRCAIPTCRQTSGLQIHHIRDWAKTQDHSFENLILLCAVCHARVTSKEIDRRSVKAYKANLGVITGRYGDLERRVLEQFVRDSTRTEVVIDQALALQLQYLVDDGVIENLGSANGAFVFLDAPPDGEPEEFYGPARWGITELGRTVVERLRTAREI